MKIDWILMTHKLLEFVLDFGSVRNLERDQSFFHLLIPRPDFEKFSSIWRSWIQSGFQPSVFLQGYLTHQKELPLRTLQ